MPSLMPFLQGNSYIIIDKKSVHPRKRPMLNTSADFIRIKFSTTENNGLLLWHTKVITYFSPSTDSQLFLFYFILFINV